MSGVILVLVGAGLMIIGGVTLAAWVNGRSRWFNVSVYDRPGASKTDRIFVDLYFAAIVIAPLLGGAMILVLGLSEMF